YYHFLQPNQYPPGSKPLSPEERRLAYWHDLPARSIIEEGYPLLREAGKRLARRGVRFHDLSLAFARVEATLYVDNWCHFNPKGNEILAEAMPHATLQTREPPRAAPGAAKGKSGPAPAAGR